MSALLEVEGIAKRFGGLSALVLLFTREEFAKSLHVVRQFSKRFAT